MDDLKPFTEAELVQMIARLEAKVDLLLRASRRARPAAEAVSLTRAAAVLGVSRGRTLPGLISSGALKTVSIAGKVRVPKVELERLVAEGVPEVRETPVLPRARRSSARGDADAIRALKVV
jgi:hypothetical protein